jgi:H+/Cl- antiporter ClcA
MTGKGLDVDTGNDDLIDRRTAVRGGALVLGLGLLIGLASGFATWAFLAIDHVVVQWLWTTLPAQVGGALPAWAVPVTVVASMTLLAAAVVALSGGRPFDVGVAVAEYEQHGRIGYRRIIPGAAFSLLSLFSGAVVGPEASLTDINGGLGTLLGERLGVTRDRVRVMAYAGVAGALGAFLGGAPVGALLAVELLSPKRLVIGRLTLVAGLAAGAVAFGVYYVLGGEHVAALLPFPDYAGPSVVDLGVAVVLGLVGGVIGLGNAATFMKARTALAGLRARPWLAALAGGAVTVVVAVVSPYLLFSGQSQLPTLLQDAAKLGAPALLGLGIAKLALHTWGVSTAYFGGPIFPTIFAGTCIGLAINQIVPAIPPAVAVMATIAGMTAVVTVAPLSMTLLLAIMSGPALVSVIAVAAVAGFLVRQVVAPTVPNMYSQSGAADQEAAPTSAY